LSTVEPSVNESISYINSGISLDKVTKKIKDNLELCSKLKIADVENFQFMLLTQLDKLNGKHISKEKEEKLNLILETTEYHFTKATYKFMRLKHYCLSFNWIEADKLASKMGKESMMFAGLFIQTEFNFYKNIALLKSSGSKNLLKKSFTRRKINSALNKINKWVESVPENHQYRTWMIEGLLEEYKGNNQNAIILLEQAATEAEKQQFTHNAAICYHFLSEACEVIGYNVRSKQYKNKSKELFKQWGVVKS
jgi:hypothetical protein